VRGIILDVEGIISTGVENYRRRTEAALAALHHQGCRATQHQFNEALQEMRAAHADQPNEAALWQIFRGFALEQGMDHRRRAKEWEALLADFRGLSGYVFQERLGVRKLLEELRFNTTDLSGDVPRVIAVSDRGAFVSDSLEQAKLAPLLDGVHVTGVGTRSKHRDSHQSTQPMSHGQPTVSAGEIRAHDARFMSEVLAYHELEPAETLVAGSRIAAFLSPAKQIGCVCIRLLAEADAGMRARGPWEEPDREVYSLGELADVIFDWLNTPISRRRRVHGI